MIMRASHFCCSCLLLLLCISLAHGADVTIGARTLHVADGFDVELVAGPPIVERPISISMDPQGRLYVTDSGGLSAKADIQLAQKPHRIRRLEDSHGDGHYDKSILFAEHLMFPEGCMWYGGSVYVAAPPQIWKFTDADGTGKNVQREVWFDGKTLTGCGNDLHGPYLGRDGWFYWCKGAFAEQHYTLANGKEMVTKASHIFRARPDGTGIEPVLTGGMDNPVGVAFLSNGERILSCTFFQNPAAGHRDGLIHAIYGGLYGKKHGVLDGHVMTGDLMPVMVHEGAAAPCGLMAASEQLFGGGYGDNVFACYFNLHKVTRHELIPDGATYTTRDTDLISCDHPDFHPTDVLEDADGSLLVVDTGGWYKVCCPTSVLAKPDVMGGIYRIRKHGAAKVEDPYGLKIGWDGLKPADVAELFRDKRLFVRRQAAARLRQETGELKRKLIWSSAWSILANDPNVAARRDALWMLSGINDSWAREEVREALRDVDHLTRAAAIHIAGLWRDPEALNELLHIVRGDDSALVRPAAEAIGRIGDSRAMFVLFRAIGKLGAFTPDSTGSPAAAPERVLEHSLIYAMIEMRDVLTLSDAVHAPSPNTCRAALVALDQMESSPIKPEQAIPLLNSDSPIVKLTAAWVVGHHPDWGASLVDHFQKSLLQPPVADLAKADLSAQLAQLCKSPKIRDLLATTLSQSHDVEIQRICIKAMAASELSSVPTAWFDELARVLPTAQGTLLTDAVTAARALPQPKGGHAALVTALVDVGRKRENAALLRVEALQAAGNFGQPDAELFKDLLAMLRPAEPMEVRRGAAAVLAKARLTSEQFADLADAVRSVGPLELPRILLVLDRAAATESLGMKLLGSLKDSPGRKGLRHDALEALLAKYPPAVQQAGAELLAALNTSAAEQAAHLDKLMKELPPGDIRRGQEVFISKRVACITCHTIGYNGGRLGPDLSTIGKVRNTHDLLEAIVYPSASFARGYEPVMLKLRDGEPLVGIVASETHGEIILNTGPAETKRIPFSNIIEMRPSPLSLMPDGFENILSRQELADVLAFLADRK
jgi:putative membrane-bound dehydrogenase-like protein